MRRRPLGLGLGLALATAACGGADPAADDVVGPYTGPVTRYVVDRIDLPTTTAQIRELADDLDGDFVVDNSLGQALATLAGYGDLHPHPEDLLRAGAIASYVELQADDPHDDPTVAVRLYGRAGDPAVEAGGRLVGGAFASNRTRATAAPGRATLRLPVFDGADPVAVVVDGLELDLVPDASGGGYTALVRGGVGRASEGAIAAGLLQMIASAPRAHRNAAYLFDPNHDGALDAAEVVAGSLWRTFFAPDLALEVDGATLPAASLGLRLHLTPCAEGTCQTASPPPTCADRIANGDETGVDCGGACGPCAGGEACGVPGDCQSQACADGRCAAPSCADGLVDGLEADVDCGYGCPTACAGGQACGVGEDCASGRCGDGARCAP